MPRPASLLLSLFLTVTPALAQDAGHEHGAHGHAHHGATADTTRKKVEPPRVFLDKSPRIVQYQLGRLDDARLLMVERSTDDPKYAPVYAAILSRPGVSARERKDALDALVTLNDSDAVTELLRVLEPLAGNDPGEVRAADELTELLLARPAEVLRDRVAELTEATAAANRPARVAGYAGLLAAGRADLVRQRAVGADARRDWLAAVPRVSSDEARVALREEVVGLLGADDPDTARAAIDALAAIPADRADTFRRLVPLLDDEALRPAAVRTLLSVPADDRDPALSETAVQELVALAENTPAADRTTDEFTNAMQLADGLLARVPADRVGAYRDRLREVSVRVVRIETVEEEMRYDTAYFAVEAGRPVQIVLDNLDLMPHNLVVTTPGQLRDVAERGLAVGPAGGENGKQYVPDGEDVLFATDLVDANASARLTFTAPAEPGEYPYVCTFPRHWMRMYGVMVVVPDLDAWLRNPTVPEDPIGNTRTFVRKWTVEDLAGGGPAGDLDNKLRGRSPEIGRRIFTEATCAQCHRADSGQSLVGPSLVGVFDRWAERVGNAGGGDAAVLREILDPSAHIDPKYAVRLVVLDDGRALSGLVTAETDDTVSILADPEAEEPTVVEKDAVLEMVQTDVSLMPKALLDRFTEDEIYELLAYLRGLEPGAAGAAMQPAAAGAAPTAEEGPAGADDAMPPTLPGGERPANFGELRERLAPLGYDVHRPELVADEGVRELAGLTFAEPESGPLKLDLYLPAVTGEREPPLVVLIHGGGWRKGTRANERNKALWLANRGYAAATIDYRLAGTAPFPAAVEDCRAAVRWLRSRAGEHGYDPNRIAAVGSSAGAHLAALLATATGRPLDEESVPDALPNTPGVDPVSDAVQAAVVIAGPTDTESEQATTESRRPDSNYRLFLGGTFDEFPARYATASPAHWVTADTPPLLLIGEDTLDSFDGLRAKLSDLGVSAQTFLLTGGLHGEWNWEPWFTPTMERIDTFLEQAWESWDVPGR